MTLRLIPDDEDDRMSANPEDPRGDLGYADTTAPRLRARPTGRPTHWAFVEREGAAPAVDVPGAVKRCRTCPAEVAILHAIGDDPRRLYCGACQGAENRRIIGYAKAAEPEPEQPGKGGRR